MAAELATRTTRSGSPLVLFLDLDDVCCLNSPYGGYDAALALSGRGDVEEADLWERLMDADAVALLRRIDEEFRPEYVLSTSWWWVMDDATLRQVLHRSGLWFVEQSLHAAACTPKGPRHGTRWTEIGTWLEAHPKSADAWVVLDDTLSGTGLASELPAHLSPFVVLCKPGVGLTPVEYEQLRTAFILRRVPARPSLHDPRTEER